MWRIWVDTGGTFTDCVAIDEAGKKSRAKVLSTSSIRGRSRWIDSNRRLGLEGSWDLPADFFCGAQIFPLGRPDRSHQIRTYDAALHEIEVESVLDDAWSEQPHFEIESGVEAPVLAAHWVTRTPLNRALPPIWMRLATTRGTNALLERRGSPPALFVSSGFGDLLEIGNQQRPDLFSLNIVKPDPLYGTVIEVPERISSDGDVLEPLDLASIDDQIQHVLKCGIRSAAIAFLHSYRDPKHESELERHLLERGFIHVSSSARLAPRIKIVPRAETAVVNAYLSVAIETYLQDVQERLSEGRLHVLTSSGGLVRAQDYQPKDSLLSGPAGGVVGAAAVALASGFERSIALDMGGTSTDVSRYDREYDYAFETTVGDIQLLAPSLAIETVAAGGGSICHFDGRQLKVGPQSAGASPGPACYGAGGPLTVTDVNLLLGRLDPDGFEIPIDVPAAERAASALIRDLEETTGDRVERDSVLQGLLSIANERMAEAIRRISIRQGYDPAGFALVAFGGAGGQHACELAHMLGMETILIPQDASLLSAVGLGQARVERFSERQVLLELSKVQTDLDEWFALLVQEATAALMAEGVDASEVEIRRHLLFLRLVGQESSLEIDYLPSQSPTELFRTAYQAEFGYPVTSSAIEVEAIRVVASTRSSSPERPSGPVVPSPATPSGQEKTFLNTRWVEVDRFRRADLHPGSRFRGPCLILERHSATLVSAGWGGSIDSSGTLVLSTSEDRGPAAGTPSRLRS